MADKDMTAATYICTVPSCECHVTSVHVMCDQCAVPVAGASRGYGTVHVATSFWKRTLRYIFFLAINIVSERDTMISERKSS